MTSVLGVRPVIGEQQPRIRSVPAWVSSAGSDFIECARLAGLFLDPWQQLVLTDGLGLRADGKFAAFEVAGCVPRQNGKGGIIEALELGCLFVLEDPLVIHSAHLFDTSKEALRRLLELIESVPMFDQEVRRVSRSHGEEGIELMGGSRIRFRTRTKGGGRGLTGDKVILDEAMFLAESSIGALLPTMAARPNPQAWFFGSAVDQQLHPDGQVFARLRERALEGGDPSLAYFEWSAPADSLDELSGEMAADPDVWAQANPALGIRVSAEHVARERLSMDPRTFAVERLGVGDWPAADGSASSVINPAVWAEIEDTLSRPAGRVAFGFDVSPDRRSASIAAAGLRADGFPHVEVVDRRPGTGWLVERLAEVCARNQHSGVVCDGVGPASSLIADMARAGVEVRTVNGQEYARACGLFYDAVEQRRLRHLGTSELSAAVKGAARRPLGDAWAWSRKSSAVDISPLVAATLALSQASAYKPSYRVRSFA